MKSSTMWKLTVLPGGLPLPEYTPVQPSDIAIEGGLAPTPQKMDH